MKTLELSDGSAVPLLGMGTWKMQGETCREAVRDALEIGYRHIDTAQMYENESDVGAAIRESGLPRDEVFVCTKVWWERGGSKEDAAASIDESLERLGLEQVDLLLMHWPPPGGMGPILEAMTEAHVAGKARLLGVSNCTTKLVEEARAIAPIACNQVEYHPFLSQRAVIEQARELGMWVTAYCPLAQGKVMDHPTIAQLALRIGKTPVQVVLRWLLEQDHVAAIPKAESAAHRRDNLAALDFELTPTQHEAITMLARDDRLIDPEWAPDWTTETADTTD